MLTNTHTITYIHKTLVYSQTHTQITYIHKTLVYSQTHTHVRTYLHVGVSVALKLKGARSSSLSRTPTPAAAAEADVAAAAVAAVHRLLPYLSPTQCSVCLSCVTLLEWWPPGHWVQVCVGACVCVRVVVCV